MVETAEYRHVNNLTYNNHLRIAQLQTQAAFITSDWIKNIVKRGPLNTDGSGYDSRFLFASGAQSIYMLGNKTPHVPNPDGDQWTDNVDEGDGTNGDGTFVQVPDVATPTGWHRATPLPTPSTYPITAESVSTLEATLLPTIGAYRRLNCEGTWTNNQLTHDALLVSQYTNNTGPSVIPDKETDAYPGGFPSVAGGTACTDTDSDGMPDAWETARGLNPNSSADAATDRDADGYTNIEEFIYAIGATSVVSATLNGAIKLLGSVKIQ